MALGSLVLLACVATRALAQMGDIADKKGEQQTPLIPAIRFRPRLSSRRRRR